MVKGARRLSWEIAICHEEPARPGSIAELDSDLDAIVLKAMRKEPRQRYASVLALDEDLRRYLEGYPVEARRGGRRYAAAKFVRRHRLAITAAGLIVAALTWGIFSTRRAQARAERRFAEVREMTNKFLFDFNDAISTLPGATQARSMLVERAIVYLDRLAAESTGDPELQAELAKGYAKLRDVKYQDGYPSLGDSQRAIESGEKSIRLWEGVVAARPRDLKSRAALGDAYRKQAGLMTVTRSPSDAIPHLQRCIEIYEACLKADPNNNDFRLGLAESYFVRSDSERVRGNAEQSRVFAEKAVALKEQGLQVERNAVNAYGLANAYMLLGDVDRNLTVDLPRAEAAYKKGLATAEEALRLAPGGEQQLRTLAMAHQRLALTYNAANRLDDARPHAEATMDLHRTLMQKDPANIVYIRGARSGTGILGNLLEKQGDLQAAIELYREGVALGEKVVERDSSNPEVKTTLAINVHLLGTALGKAGDRAGSRAALERAAALREPVAKAQPDRIDLQERLAVNYLALGLWHAAGTDCRTAKSYYSKSEAIFDRLQKNGKITGNGTVQLKRLHESAAKCGG